MKVAQRYDRASTARLVGEGLVKIDFDGVCYSLVGATGSAKERLALCGGHRTQKEDSRARHTKWQCVG
jgi:hypothetical protein